MENRLPTRISGNHRRHPGFARQVFPECQSQCIEQLYLYPQSKGFAALNKVDNNILKLDTVDPDYIQTVDRPTGNYQVEDIIEGLKAFNGNLIIQTIFLKGTTDEGKDVDNTTDKYVLPWLEAVKQIRPRQVMVYTIDRETPDQKLQKATHEELDRIVRLVKEAGIDASASY